MRGEQDCAGEEGAGGEVTVDRREAGAERGGRAWA